MCSSYTFFFRLPRETFNERRREVIRSARYSEGGNKDAIATLMSMRVEEERQEMMRQRERERECERVGEKRGRATATDIKEQTLPVYRTTGYTYYNLSARKRIQNCKGIQQVLFLTRLTSAVSLRFDFFKDILLQICAESSSRLSYLHDALYSEFAEPHYYGDGGDAVN